MTTLREPPSCRVAGFGRMRLRRRRGSSVEQGSPSDIPVLVGCRSEVPERQCLLPLIGDQAFLILKRITTPGRGPLAFHL